MIHWVERGPPAASSVRGVSGQRGEGEGGGLGRGVHIHPVYFIAGKRGGRLKLGVRSLRGWESTEGREGFVLGELALAEAGGSIHSLQASGQPPSPPPTTTTTTNSPAEVEFAGRSRSLPGLPHPYGAGPVI